ncbi:MAG TPA: signal peptide peptidase SppA [Myxococcota bacterium]|nr:signal peptide peptidase SppA [Myxococcota bacterium]
MSRSVLVVLTLAVLAVIGIALFAVRHRLPDHSVVVLKLEGDVDEAPPTDIVGQWTSRGPAFPTLLLALDMATADARVDGVLVHIKETSVGYARLQELRDALQRVRDGGKRVVALIEGEGLNGTRELFLASAANRVLIDPAAISPLGGVTGQYVFLAGFLEKLGIHVEVSRVGEYKSAVEQFAAKEMSPKAREMSTDLIDGAFAQIVDGLASGRHLTGERVRELFEKTPCTPQELVDAGLVDEIADRHDALEKGGFPGGKEVEVEAYLRQDPHALGLRSGPEIALVFGTGVISGERARLSKGFTADETEKALDDAAKDDDIKAVVLRVNSPGGDVLASDRIYRAIKRVREKKPVVISMADYAASGGYYVSAAANAILAEPATLTGSIGVFALRPVFAGVYEKLDIGREMISRGAYAPVSGSDSPMTPHQQERTDAITQAAYAEFLARVSEGRGQKPEAIDKVGRGRVWLGSDALARNLVDELGGLAGAVERARREAKLDKLPDPARVILPAPPGLVDQLRSLVRGDSILDLAQTLLARELPELPALPSLPPDGALAYLPPYWLELR